MYTFELEKIGHDKYLTVKTETSSVCFILDLTREDLTKIMHRDSMTLAPLDSDGWIFILSMGRCKLVANGENFEVDIMLSTEESDTLCNLLYYEYETCVNTVSGHRSA